MAHAPAPHRTEPDPPSADEAAALPNASWSDPDWGLLLWLDHAHRPAPRRDLSTPLATHRSRARGVVGAPVQRADEGRRQGEEHEDRADAQDGARRAHGHAPDRSSGHVGAALRPPRHRAHPRRVRLLRPPGRIAAGVDIRTVAGRLGHGSGGATTLEVYAAWADEADRRAARTMAAIVPKPVPAPPRPRGPYVTTAPALREQIRSGQLKPGDRLPTVAELAVANTVAVGAAHRPQGRGFDRSGARWTRCGPRARTRDRSGVELAIRGAWPGGAPPSVGRA